MGKITPISTKYTIHADVELSSIAEKPDVIGAIFGQTEGLLGSELELRELQKSGKIGRIEVNLESKKGKTNGEILLPSSMDMSETAIIAASLETIEKVGPCDSKIKVTKIEDVRVSKRDFVLKRAKELLKDLVGQLPDSQEFTNLLTKQVRENEIKEYGKDRLPSGPAIDDSEEVIIVEGRADVLNLLRYGIRNVIALNGARACDTVINLSRQKVTTLFVDGDRGGELIVRNLSDLGDIDFVARAPDGKEVEELTQKEIQKALRAKISWDQTKTEKKKYNGEGEREEKEEIEKRSERKYPERRENRESREKREREDDRHTSFQLPRTQAGTLKDMAEELMGTRGAFVLDEAMNILGKVPGTELVDTLQNMSDDVYAIVLDGTADSRLAKTAEDKNVKVIVAGDSSAGKTRIKIASADEL